jgi:hypothetical protein
MFRLSMLIFICLLSKSAAASTHSNSNSNSNSFSTVEALALKGDYQAQRNVAFGYASLPLKGQTHDAIRACGWYELILQSGSPKLHAGDVGNVSVYCTKLDFDSRAAAKGQARALYKKIYKMQPNF